MGERLLGPIAVRLALAFVAVAVAAVAVLAILTVNSTRSEVAALVERERRRSAAAVSAALARAYREADGWGGADVRAAQALASGAGADLGLLDSTGEPVFMPGGKSGFRGNHEDDGFPFGSSGERGFDPSGGERRVPIVVSGVRVGTALLLFRGAGLPPGIRQARDALMRGVALGAGVACLLAIVVAVGISKRITRPLVRLTNMARALEAGNLDARAGPIEAPGELGELVRAADRMAEGLAREDALRRALVADVAHELRTPVTILRGLSEEMVDGHVEPSATRIASLHDEVLRLSRIVEDLETLAAAEAAGLRLERRPVDLAKVAHEAVELLRTRFAVSDLSVQMSLERVTVEGDATRLSQIVTNLLTNAIKFTPSGGRVNVRVARDGGLARVEVADTGRGIPPDELPHVFERFWRGREARGTGGSGIGLAVVAELVRAHNGRVEVQSEPGRGSRFSVLFPAASSSAETTGATSARGSGREQTRSPEAPPAGRRASDMI